MKVSVLLLVVLSTLSGCIVTQVKPWEHDVMARENMQLEHDELIDAMDEQNYYSKEASFGGKGIGGGGCGCN